MSRSVNQVILIGNVGKEPEIRVFENGIKVATFSVATSTGGYKKQDGTDVPEKTSNEEWRAIIGYEGLYEVSSIGRVRSLTRIDHLGRLYKERIIGFNKSGSEYDNVGYIRVNLTKNGKSHYHYVHRLVAEAFIPNIENKPIVDHANTIRNDNRVSNLRWATEKDNGNNCLSIRKCSINARWRGKTGSAMCRSKKTYQRNIDGSLIRVWDSASEAASSIGVDIRNISNCCIGKQKTAYGFKWNY